MKGTLPVGWSAHLVGWAVRGGAASPADFEEPLTGLEAGQSWDVRGWFTQGGSVRELALQLLQGKVYLELRTPGSEEPPVAPAPLIRGQMDVDYDADGIGDYYETRPVELGLRSSWVMDPFDRDSDDDGLLDGEEIRRIGLMSWRKDQTNPSGADSEPEGAPDGIPDGLDSDRDGLADGLELGMTATELASRLQSPADRFHRPARIFDVSGLGAWEPPGTTSAHLDSNGDIIIRGTDPDAECDDTNGGTAPCERGLFLIDADPATRTDPNAADTDNDGNWDGPDVWTAFHLRYGEDHDGDGKFEPKGANERDDDYWDDETDPLDPSDKPWEGGPIEDEDRDRLEDAQEENFGCDPKDRDTDDDGLLDGDEVMGTHACMVDGFSYQTLPYDPDTDGDGIPDGTELGVWGSEPTGTPMPGFLATDESATFETWDYSIGAPMTRSTYTSDADMGDIRTMTDPTEPDTNGDGLRDGMQDLNGNGAYDFSLGETDAVVGLRRIPGVTQTYDAENRSILLPVFRTEDEREASRFQPVQRLHFYWGSAEEIEAEWTFDGDEMTIEPATLVRDPGEYRSDIAFSSAIESVPGEPGDFWEGDELEWSYSLVELEAAIPSRVGWGSGGSGGGGTARSVTNVTIPIGAMKRLAFKAGTHWTHYESPRLIDVAHLLDLALDLQNSKGLSAALGEPLSRAKLKQRVQQRGHGWASDRFTASSILDSVALIDWKVEQSGHGDVEPPMPFPTQPIFGKMHDLTHLDYDTDPMDPAKIGDALKELLDDDNSLTPNATPPCANAVSWGALLDSWYGRYPHIRPPGAWSDTYLRLYVMGKDDVKGTRSLEFTIMPYLGGGYNAMTYRDGIDPLNANILLSWNAFYDNVIFDVLFDGVPASYGLPQMRPKNANFALRTILHELVHWLGCREHVTEAMGAGVGEPRYPPGADPIYQSLDLESIKADRRSRWMAWMVFNNQLFDPACIPPSKYWITNEEARYLMRSGGQRVHGWALGPPGARQFDNPAIWRAGPNTGVELTPAERDKIPKKVATKFWKE